MFWRTFTTTVVLLLAIAGVIAADQSVSDRATLTLQGTVDCSADVSIRPSHDNPDVTQVDAATNTRGGLVLTLEGGCDSNESALTINGVPARFENGRAHVGHVPRTRSRVGTTRSSGEADTASGSSILVGYSGDSTAQVVLEIAAR